jgi:PHD/YefM family antitoxin component YafN of YafNO toxin-antitoxin module
MTINANEVKKRGVSVFDTLLHKFDELIINVRGKEKYVVLDIERYREFRAKELDLAYLEAMQDIDEGRVKHQRADEHLEELAKELKIV